MVLKTWICFKNTGVDNEVVQSAAQDELGEKIRVIDWWIEGSIDYQGLVSPGILMPQHMIIVGLEYEMDVSTEDSQTTE
ncbi:hypothetical protein KKF05_02940 [Patescibacteria group bacterium]|nr:hypothetical protein [Patescibacteria group bacterium]MBU1915610.1 hypothetical protein [Patescibacteria group bacterium]